MVCPMACGVAAPSCVARLRACGAEATLQVAVPRALWPRHGLRPPHVLRPPPRAAAAPWQPHARRLCHCCGHLGAPCAAPTARQASSTTCSPAASGTACPRRRGRRRSWGRSSASTSPATSSSARSARQLPGCVFCILGELDPRSTDPRSRPHISRWTPRPLRRLFVSRSQIRPRSAPDRLQMDHKETPHRSGVDPKRTPGRPQMCTPGRLQTRPQTYPKIHPAARDVWRPHALLRPHGPPKMRSGPACFLGMPGLGGWAPGSVQCVHHDRVRVAEAQMSLGV